MLRIGPETAANFELVALAGCCRLCAPNPSYTVVAFSITLGHCIASAVCMGSGHVHVRAGHFMSCAEPQPAAQGAQWTQKHFWHIFKAVSAVS